MRMTHLPIATTPRASSGSGEHCEGALRGSVSGTRSGRVDCASSSRSPRSRLLLASHELPDRTPISSTKGPCVGTRRRSDRRVSRAAAGNSCAQFLQVTADPPRCARRSGRRTRSNVVRIARTVRVVASIFRHKTAWMRWLSEWRSGQLP